MLVLQLPLFVFIQNFGKKVEATVEIDGPVVCSLVFCSYTCPEGLEGVGEFELEGISSLDDLRKVWGISQKLTEVFGRDKKGNVYPDFEVYFDLEEYIELDFIEEKLLGKQLFAKARSIAVWSYDGKVELEEVVGITADGKEVLLVRRKEDEM